MFKGGKNPKEKIKKINFFKGGGTNKTKKNGQKKKGGPAQKKNVGKPRGGRKTGVCRFLKGGGKRKNRKRGGGPRRKNK